ncbi:FtsX-like permease family protein [Neglectibacter sp. X58]|uniref:ABC transporter permease n=1 Tax=unclassified Neglectibacter TaxID=2632164 RepID=UPI00325B2CFE
MPSCYAVGAKRALLYAALRARFCRGSMLESIGMEERQVRNMLFWESFLFALQNILITLTFGTVTGFAFISFMQKSATYLEYHFPIIAVVLYIIGMIGIPMLISLGCLKRQNNISLVERIRNED